MPSQLAPVDGFDPKEYLVYFPSAHELAKRLERMFTEKEYGWKSRARLLKEIHKAYTRYTALLQKLEESASRPAAGRKAKPLSPRQGLQLYLLSLSDEDLKIIASEKNVSYKSYMGTGDKEGLIEAILDEMVPTPQDVTV